MDLSVVISDNIVLFWSLIGVLSVIGEVFLLPSGGLLFAGMGCLMVSTLISLSIITREAYLDQFVIFAVSTAFVTLVLWRPLKNLLRKTEENGYSNIIGSSAAVESDIYSNTVGKVRWSGTTMKAKIDLQEESDIIKVGETVVITAINENVVSVKKL